MDSFALREELANLQKSLAETKHIYEVMDKRVKELHIEEMRYLEEIPKYKKQAQEEKQVLLKLESGIPIARKELENITEQFKKIKELVIGEEEALREVKAAGHNIEKECAIKKSNILRQEENIKMMQIILSEREGDCVNKEEFNKKVELDLDNREIEIKNKERALEHGYQELNSSIDSYKSNLSDYAEKLRSLNEQRKFLEDDKQLTQDKLQKADKILKENLATKASLMLQADKMSNAIKSAEDKQRSLDRALADLVNQENVLKIKELKINKLIRDHGLQKELKELQESVK